MVGEAKAGFRADTRHQTPDNKLPDDDDATRDKQHLVKNSQQLPQRLRRLLTMLTMPVDQGKNHWGIIWGLARYLKASKFLQSFV